jgi:6-phosphogluconolactonase
MMASSVIQAVWPDNAALIVQYRLNAVRLTGRRCSVMLTGGRSASQLYSSWSRLPEFSRTRGVDFYFGDERCVSPDDPDSNFGLAMRTLFAEGIPDGCAAYRMEAESADAAAAADRYGALLPSSIDILLLGVGEDGHIASLFPHSEALRETRRRVVPVVGPEPPVRRLTVTPPVIRHAQTVFVLAPGAKMALRAAARQESDDIEALPARLVLDATWLQ